MYGNERKAGSFWAACREEAGVQGERQTLLERLDPLTGRHPTEPDEQQQAARVSEGERKSAQINMDSHTYRDTDNTDLVVVFVWVVLAAVPSPLCFPLQR